ncbi:hypothetical protein [Aestuariivirga sp.]|uniref:hypothetical protein n=1 Tax=Aestuariivirga sp. TaxID=2650926 RepID=UPI0039E39252
MRISGWNILFFVVSSAMALVSWSLYSICNDPDNELANYHEWSVLQSTGSRYQGQLVEPIVLVKAADDEGYDLVGVLSSGGKSRVWIMANPRIRPFVKTMPPDGKVRITHQDFDAIRSATKLNKETEQFLANSIQD